MTPSSLLKDFAFVLLLATVSLCAGLLINQLRDKPLPLIYHSKQERLEQAVSRIKDTPAVPTKQQAKLPPQLALSEFQQYVEKKQGIVLDARPEIFHRLGHIPGALSLPREDFENGYTQWKKILEADKNQPLVIYCSSSSCEDSKLLQKALVELGYSQVVVFPGGWAEWTGANLPEETNK